MLHIFGYAAIAVAGGAIGYWLRGRTLEAKPHQGEKKEERQKQLSQNVSNTTESTPSEKE